MARLVYSRIFAFLLNDESWQEELFLSFKPHPGDRILSLGPYSSSLAQAFARRHPDATFSAIDTDFNLVSKKYGTELLDNSFLVLLL